MKIKILNQFTITSFIIILLTGCVTLKPYYDKSELTWQKAVPPDSSHLKYTVFLIGDAGNPEDSRQEPTLKLAQNHIFQSKKIKIGGKDSIVYTSSPKDVVMFLGDNIYNTGLPEPDDSDRKEKERRIIEQMNIVKNFKGRKIFVPGNHDWNESYPGGLAAVNRQEEFVENYLDSADVFLPSNGCPGPVELQLNDDLVVIVLDSEWWLHKYEKPIAPDNGCTAGNRLEILEQVKDIIVRNRGKHVVIALHHPLFSNGKHGGYYSAKDYIFPLTLVRDQLYIPLPVIGSIYPFMRQYGISRQDLSNKDYQQLKRGLLTILEGEKNIVIAAGHEHALQFNRFENINHIISGAGAKSNSMAKGNDALFAHGTKGFAKVNYYDNGQSWVEFWEPEGDGSTGKLMYRTPLYALPPKGNAEVREEKQINYKDSVKVLAAGAQYEASAFKRSLYGEHYRDTWATPIKVNYLDLSTFAGGLTPLKMGGGKQTTSLQLQGKDGNVYQFRTVSKDPSTLLPQGFIRTFADDFFQDQISSAHPYGGLMIPDMAKAIGIYYVTPQLVYMPYSRLLGPYIQQVGGKLGTIEARPDEDVSDFKSFGNAKNAISTHKLYEQLHKDNDNEVDQVMYLKARLFDILINDWDRHEDQWRWAEFKKEKGSIYRPIPRDRDQAFTKYDGILPRVISKVVPDLQSFEYEIKDVAKLSIAARNLDRNFLNKLTHEQWLQIAFEVQTKLTDKVIEDAVRKMPPEVFSISGQEIISKLKSRRNGLTQAAEEYYTVLSKEVTVTGTNKHEFVVIDNGEDYTRLAIYKINSERQIEKPIFSRDFFRDETRELNVFALDGRDSIIVRGKNPSIKVRIVGGEGSDYFVDNTTGSGKNILVFDSDDNAGTIHDGSSSKIDLSKYETIHEYNRNAFKYDKRNFIPSFDYNVDDGVFIGAGYSIKHYGFRKEPYSYTHLLQGNYAPRTGANSISYTGNIYSILGRNNDIIVKAEFNGPKYTFNYFGQGNSTQNVGDDIDYYRIRTKNLSFTTYFQKRFTQAFRVGLGPGYELYWIEKPMNTFLTSEDFGEKSDLNNPSRFAALRSYANIDFVDNPLFPTSGVRWNNEINYFSELKQGNDNFAQVKTDISFYGTPNLSFPVTAAIRLGGAKNFGDYKFFQSNFLGNTTNLRGYRNNRFAGRSYLYQNSELRFKVSSFRNYIITGNFGLFGFFDSGRVYSESPEENTWHTAYGPGAWINFYNKFLVSAGYGISKEGRYFSINSGFSF
ncbi:BamA/TamA family outer membrane protein [Paradesertivirga mongoliensis]|uniref:BamA/TamA family outer membrane protein n=1 Tax=Paradesertivirga mongoliensis TaxID=2100740 RepID=A0ABW4ZGA3_9SPHI|nr:metallophosphoesterase [Pedobacter mongoliensis]